MKNLPYIVHIAPDEKFINFANEVFEEIFFERNIFYIISNTNKALTYVDKKANVKIVSSQEIIDIVERNSKQWDFAFLHSIVMPEHFHIMQNMDKSCSVIWFCFGFEVYNDPYLFPTKKLYFKETYKVTAGNTTFLQRMKLNRYIRMFFRPFLNLPLSENEKNQKIMCQKRQTVAKIDFLASSFREENINLKKILNRPNLQNFEFWYSTVEKIDVEKRTPQNKYTSLNILIGNSASFVCNHLDVFTKLKKNNLDLANYNLILPLSYGGNQEYISLIKEKSSHDFPHIQYIEEFMNLAMYQDLLATCHVAIIASRRQHAVSNAIILLARGTKLFLSVDNPFFHYLKRIGIHVYSFEEDLNSENLTPLSDEKTKNNKNILYHLLNRKRLLENIEKQVFDIFEKNVSNINVLG